MKIKQRIETIPGGMMVIPLVAGAAINTFFPQALEIGGFTSALFKNGAAALIGAFLFSMGAGINLEMLLQGGLAGIALGVLTTLVGGFFNIRADRLAGGSGVAGAAASSTAGNAVATPMAIAQADPSLAEISAAAAPLIAASVITTAILTPLLTTWGAKRHASKGEK